MYEPWLFDETNDPDYPAVQIPRKIADMLYTLAAIEGREPADLAAEIAAPVLMSRLAKHGQSVQMIGRGIRLSSGKSIAVRKRAGRTG